MNIDSDRLGAVKILLVHNYYQQRGGEDQAFDAEAMLLERGGHTVRRFTRHNNMVARVGQLALACGTVWNGAAHQEIRALLQQEHPDVVHFHNTLPLISPAAYYAARAEGVPVVQTLHNYRLICANGLFYRDEHICEDCIGKLVPWPAVAHACYRGSRAASGVIAAMLSVHRTMGTWTNTVDMYIALTGFALDRFIQAGLPAEKIAIKPNFPELAWSPRYNHDGYAVFIGRLSPEKGLLTLIRAWRQLSWLPLRVIGDGPLREVLNAQIEREGIKGVDLLGPLTQAECLRQLSGARFLVLPSECYEGFPRVIVEAYACGKPVIASRLGAMAELVLDGRTGLHFTPGDAEDLAEKVEWMARNDAMAEAMGRAARREFELKYTEERNYELLMEIYKRAIERRGAQSRG